MKKKSAYFFLSFFLLSFVGFGQNVTAKWYFGNYAGLDFMSNPPAIIAGSSMTVTEGCASISDNNGNLLFYTDGMTVWNQANAVMANGTGLLGSNTACQSSIIIKKPGSSTLYFIFTIQGQLGVAGLNYSIVDMSLAAGMGSVTVLNTPLFSSVCSEKLTATRHCNGMDVWVLSHDYNSTNFRAHLLTSSGVNTVVVVSPVGTNQNLLGRAVGAMKLSPNGKKIGVALNPSSSNTGMFELYDFDNTTGVVSNSLSLASNLGGSYGCEFSPDATVFYGGGNNNGKLYQWNLCAGSNAAIVASQYTFSAYSPGSMQLAPNGKIYMVHQNQQTVGVINNPNVYGAGCNFITNGQSVSPNTSYSGLPNFMGSLFLYHPLPQPFTSTLSCINASFSAPPAPITATGCAVSYSLLSLAWDFGDPASGAANTSTLNNPTHTFSGLGTFTTQLIFYYTCGGGSDTLRQVMNVNAPPVTVSTTSITCANLGSATVTVMGGVPPYSYTWMPTAQNGSVAAGLSPGSYSITVSSNVSNCVFTSTTNFTSLIPLTGTLNNSTVVPCYGVATGSASYTNLAGGSANQNYTWTNSLFTYTPATVNNLGAGTWSTTVTDALTGCVINDVFTITQPPALSLSIVANTPTVCLGGSLTLSGITSGGNPAYTYTWINGPTSSSTAVYQALAGNYSYTLVSADSNNCQTSSVVSVGFVNNPTVTLASVSICPLQSGTLNASGASSYTWSDNSNGSTFTGSPLVTTVYTVMGESMGCAATTSASIVLKPVPIPTLLTNNPVCEDAALSFSAGGGNSYAWSGPLLFTSILQNPVIAPVSIASAGVYNLIVTAINSCTALASISITVNPLPTLAALGTTVCSGQNINLSAVSSAASFVWAGPQSFTSSLQNPQISNAALPMSGAYTLSTTNNSGCARDTVVSVNVVPPPSLTIALSSNSICAQALNGSPTTLTLTSYGANSYTLSTPDHINNPNPSGPSSPLNMAPPYVPTGPATATLFGSNGVCTVSTTAVFTLVPNPTVSISNPTPVICVGQTFTYTSAGAGSYTWSTSNPGSFIYTSGDVAVASPSINSVFSVMGSSLGCNSAIQSSSMSLNPLPVMNANNATICHGASAHLSATGNSTSYTWSPSLFLNADNLPTVIASPPSNQNYLVTGSLNNCTTTALITVSVLQLPNPSLVVSKQEVCLYGKIVMQGFGGQTYEWSGPGGVQLLGQQVNYMASNLNQSGMFTLTVSDERGCKNAISTTLLVKELPNGTVMGRKEGCIPFYTDLLFKGSADISNNWSMGQQNSTGNNFSSCFKTPGTFTISNSLYDASSTCSNNIQVVINAYPQPKADFNFYPEHPLESMDEVLFSNISVGEQITDFKWFFVNNSGYKAHSENTSYLFENAGTYPVAFVAVNNWGCPDTVVKAITVEPFFNIYIPNAFTPNGDDLNDIFLAKGSGVVNYQLLIFDRWGEKVFESNSFLLGWDGNFRGEPAKTDVYNWKITATNAKGETKYFAGQVNLLR